jgi:hypothetical protein
LFPREECHEALPTSLIAIRYRCPNGILGLATLTPRSDLIRKDPIDLRAWTMQEAMLSPRLLPFSSNYLSWDCKFAKGFHYHDGMESVVRLRDKSYQQLPQWASIVEDYAAREISVSGDKSLPISAIAHHDPENSNGIVGTTRYLADLWSHELPMSLMWYNWRKRNLRPRPRNYRAPSWSWVSVDGPVD